MNEQSTLHGWLSRRLSPLLLLACMFILHTNVRGQLFKLLLLALFAFLLYVLLAHVIPEAPKDGAMWLLYLVVACFAYGVVGTGASFLGIIHVRIDPAAGTVTFRRWWGKTSVPLAELTGYNAVTYPSGRGRAVPPGWELETKDGRRFELTPSNLLALPLLEVELTSLSLPRGAQHPSTYPFTRAL